MTDKKKNQEFLLDGIDYSDVVETKVSQSDLVNLLVQREVVKYQEEAKELEKKLQDINDQGDRLGIKFVNAIRKQFKGIEDEKIKELKGVFGKKLRVSKELSFVGETWREYQSFQDPDAPLMINYWRVRPTGELYKTSKVFACLKVDLNPGGSEGSHTAISFIDWSNFYVRMDYKCSITENRGRKESTNLNYKFGNKMKADRKVLEPIHNEILECLETKTDILNRMNWIEAKISQINTNSKAIQAQITKNILESSALGTSLLSKITTERDLLNSGEK